MRQPISLSFKQRLASEKAACFSSMNPVLQSADIRMKISGSQPRLGIGDTPRISSASELISLPPLFATSAPSFSFSECQLRTARRLRKSLGIRRLCMHPHCRDFIVMNVADSARKNAFESTPGQGG